MTLRIKTLTAVAALTISAAGFALAQDASTATTPPDAAPEAAQAAPEDATTAAEAPAEGGAAQDAAPAADEAATEEAAPEAEEIAPEDATTPADDEAAQEAAPEAAEADEPAVDNAEAESPDAAAANEPASEAAATEEAAPATSDAEEMAGEEVATEEASAADDHGADEAHGEAGGDHGAGHIEDISFSFEGPFGKFDQFQLQRGLQVYTEVCAACHGMKFVPIRTLHDEGGPALPEDQVRAYAASMSIVDEETGEDRPRLPTDHFPTVTGDGMGPDLSLMAKARAGFHGPYGTGISQFINGIGGPEYIHAILVGYTGEEMEQAGSLFYENTAFPGGYISMPAPLSDDLVTYEDGTPATVDQMARDVSAFLMWTAEPKMMDRKMVGLVSVLLLIVLTALLYLTNKRLWAPHKGRHTEA